MRGTVVKKIRKYARRNWIEYVNALMEWPYRARLRFAWYLIKPRKKKKKK